MNTSPTATPPQAPDGRLTGPEMREVGRLRRSISDRYVAGLSGGLGRHFDIDPVIFRVLFVVTALLGVGLFAYLALWMIVPEEGRDRGTLGLDERGRTVAMVIVVGVAGLVMLAGGWQGPDAGMIIPAALVGLVVWLISRNRSGAQQLPAGQAGYPPVGTSAQPMGAYAASAGNELQSGDQFVPGTAPGVPTPMPPAPQQRILPSYVPKPPNPKKRGPLLFGFTLAGVALAVGVLGMIDTAGVDVLPAAYPALAVAICGLMLLVGAFYGRAGGVILLGLVSLFALGVTTVAEHAPDSSFSYSPDNSAQVLSQYRVDGGEILLDLSQVSDPENLAGRTITVRADVGAIRVIAPNGIDVRVNSRIEGVGGLNVGPYTQEGFDLRRSDTLPSEITDSANPDDQNETDKPTEPLVIVTTVGVGEIEVTR